MIETFPRFFTSPASFPLVLLWFGLLLAVASVTSFFFAILAHRLSPSTIQKLYANDDLTRLRLDD
jgi:hypothetical protein